MHLLLLSQASLSYSPLYKPYEQMGGNGSAKKVMDEVDKLPVRKSNYRVGENVNENQQ